MTRMWGWTAGGLGLAVACWVVLELIDHWNFVVDPLVTAGLLTVMMLAAGGGVTLALKTLVLRILVLATTVALVVITGLTILVFAFGPDSGVTQQRVSSPGGRYELLVIDGAGFVSIDREIDVRIRAANKMFVQESLVWDGLEEGKAPETVRFSGAHAIEIVADDGCRYRSTFDPDTLAVRPVHRMGYEPGC
ncbi:hypothetical protein [Actinomadura sp. 9N407]|uniref:hypothetical protein n=1 Tax=Actinomadura sp. 9N407 TaxID=3375154 RepID=UPI003789EF69